MENSAEYFYEKLQNSATPGQIIATLFAQLYGTEYSRSEVILMNELVRIFGRFTVFFSCLDMAGTYPSKPTEVRPLLYKICKNKFERAHGEAFVPSHVSLNKMAVNELKERESLQSSKSKKKPPSSDGLKVDISWESVRKEDEASNE